MPGDPLVFLFGDEVYGIARSNPDLINQLMAAYGLDKPWLDQFLIYLQNLLSGNLGYSYSYGRPISSIVLEKLPLTLMITVPSTAIGLLLGALLGVALGWRPQERVKKLMTALSTIIYSLPPYWVAMISILIFSLKLGLFPIGGVPPSGSSLPEALSHLVLPISILTMFYTVYNIILMRGLTLQVAEEPFITTARSKGLSDLHLTVRHLLKPSLAPLLALSAIEFGFAFSGTLLIEIAFNWPGLGLTMWQAVMARDYPLLQTTFTLTAVIVILANATADVLSYKLDPRLEGRS